MTNNPLTVDRFIAASQGLCDSWKRDGVTNPPILTAEIEILSRQASYHPELIHKIVIEYIDRVRANHDRDPVRKSWWSNEDWQQYVAGRNRSISKFESQARALTAIDNWWLVPVPGHKAPYQIFRHLAEHFQIWHQP